MNEALPDELLAKRGEGYAPRLEAVHRKNAPQLPEIIMAGPIASWWARTVP
jgi:hypothetical protein